MLISLIFCCLYLDIASSQNITDIKALKRQLFVTQEYDNTTKPLINYNDMVRVHVELTLNSLVTLDEVEEKLITIGYLDVYWNDELLTWNPEDYGGAEVIYVPQSKIWKPDISLQNGFKHLEELGSNLILAVIKHNGLVDWKPFQVFESHCPLDMTFFPYDRQICKFVFGAWSSNKTDVHLYTEGVTGIILEGGIKNNTVWTVVSTSVEMGEYHQESTVTFFITLQRKPLYIMKSLVVPVVLLSLLDIFTFAIPADSGERMGYTVTVWLSFAVFLTIVGQTLPQSSETVSFLDIFIVIELIQGTVILLVSTILSRVSARCGNKEVSSRFMKFLVRWYRRKRIESCEGSNDEKGKEESNFALSWKELVSMVDYCLFWLFLTLLILVTVIISIYTFFESSYTLSAK